MAGSGEPVEFSVDRSAEEGTPMVAMAALDAGGTRLQITHVRDNPTELKSD